MSNFMWIYSLLGYSVSEDGLKRFSGEFDLEAIMVLDLSDKGISY